MRSLSALILLPAAFITLSVACKKDLGQQVRVNTSADGQVKSDDRNCGGVRIVCGMLAFDNEDHFRQVYECLEASYEEHMNAFHVEWGFLSDDEYNNMAETLGFLEEQPLIDFEFTLGFQTYRKRFDDLEELWLANGMDILNDPDDARCVHDMVYSTILNQEGAVMVGGVIYFVSEDCEWFSISDGNCTVYNNCIANPQECAGEKVWFVNDVDDKCFYNEESIAWGETSNRRSKQRFRHELTVYPYTTPLGQLVSVQKCYRKVLGVWLRHRAQRSMTTTGNAFRNNCVNSTAVSGFVSDRRWRRVLRVEMNGEYIGLLDAYPYFRECGVKCEFTNPVGSSNIKLPSACN
jgi:hypothetical protein